MLDSDNDGVTNSIQHISIRMQHNLQQDPNIADNYKLQESDPSWRQFSQINNSNFSQALYFLQKSGVSSINIDLISEGEAQLLEKLRNGEGALSSRIWDITRSACSNLCASTQFEQIKDKVLIGYRLLPDVEKKSQNCKNVDWEADKAHYARTAFVYHKLSPTDISYISKAQETEIENKPRLESFRLMMLIVLMAPDISTDKGASFSANPEDKAMDLLLNEGFIGVPLTPFGILVPILSENAMNYYRSQCSNSIIKFFCGKIIGKKKLPIFPPFFQLLVLKRISDISNVILYLYEHSQKNSALKEMHPQKENENDIGTSIFLLLLYLHSKCFIVNVLEAQPFNEENYLTTLINRQYEETGKSITNLLNFAFERDIFFTSYQLACIGHLCINLSENSAIPVMWRTNISNIFTNPRFSSTWTLRKDDRIWFEHPQKETWAKRIKRFAIVIEENINYNCFQRKTLQEKQFLAKKMPYLLFAILAGQLNAYLDSALEDFYLTKDPAQLDRFLNMYFEILEIIGKMSLEILSLSDKCTHTDINKNKLYLNQGNWNAKFKYEITLNSPWYGFINQKDFNLKELIPRYRMTTFLYQTERDLLSSRALTQTESTHIKTHCSFLLKIFNGKYFLSCSIKSTSDFTSSGYEADSESDHEDAKNRYELYLKYKSRGMAVKRNLRNFKKLGPPKSYGTLGLNLDTVLKSST